MVDSVDRFHLPGLDAGHLLRRQDRLEQRPFRRRGQGVRTSAGGQERGAVPYPPFPFAFLQERHLRRKGVVIERRFDLKDPYLLAQEPPDPPGRRM